MSSRQGHVAWALCGLTCGLAVLLTWMFFAYPEARTVGWPILTIGGILWAATGALIVTRHPGHRVGWTFIFVGLVIGIDDPLIMYADNILAGGDLGPYAAGQVAAWLVEIIDLPLPVLLISTVFVLFPDGKPPTPKWRPVLWAAWAWFVLFVVAMIVAVDPRQLGGIDGTESAPPMIAEVVLETRGIASLIIIGVGAAAVVVRLRRARSEERQQLRWLATACVAAAVMLVLPVMAEDIGLYPRFPFWLLLLPVHLALAGIAVAAGFAILKYRLYDIDLIISRTILFTAVTAVVATGYVAVVVAIGAIVGDRAIGRFWPSLLATALVAVAVQPLRTKVQRFADRVVYGERAAPYEALSEFIGKLGDSPSVSELLPRIAEATTRSVAARRSRVELDLRDGQQLSAEWPPAVGGNDDFELPVIDRGETLGRIVVSSAPGRALRPYDRRLLADLSSQLGLAFRNARLEADLQLSVEQVTRRTQELAISRRRIVAARDDEQRRLSAAIDTQVLSHLKPLIDDLQDVVVADADRDRTQGLLDRQISLANLALEALRRLSHGPVPAVLRRRGLVAALAGLGAGFEVRVASPAERRFDPQVETAAYLCARAALSSAKPTTPGQLTLTADGDRLIMIVDGVDEQVAQSSDYASVIDRVEALSGTVAFTAGPGPHATLRLDLPPVPGNAHSEPAHTELSMPGPNSDLAR